MTNPWTCWLLLRSLETLKVRMEAQTQNAQLVANHFKKHVKIEHLYYLGLLTKADSDYAIYQKQCLGPGAMISFNIKGGEKEAFAFLNNLQLIKLAVSLGGTESLAQHPVSMTHAGVDPDMRVSMGVTDKLVRISIGIENPNDIIWDIEQALEKVPEIDLVM